MAEVVRVGRAGSGRGWLRCAGHINSWCLAASPGVGGKHFKVGHNIAPRTT
ncbi:hypothetical protein GCM10010353_13210 [Streptomyces chryseus]|nr:hypothetical protein GCM10010353_13210 [Streptomyces chryseus]